MRLSVLLVAASLSLAAQASWFGGNSNTPEYSSWNTDELKAWLQVHDVPLPNHTPSQAELKALVQNNWGTASVWTQDQYASAQKAFSDLRDTAFDTWDESSLREFLLQNGIVAPKGPREHLVLLAKQRYRSFSNAASSLAAQASDSASTAVFGDTKHQLSKSASSVVADATSAVYNAPGAASTAVADAASQVSIVASNTVDDIGEKFDQSKHYVYSTWSENELRHYLESKGIIKTGAQKKRDELMDLMHKAYGSIADPIWDAWSDSYIHNWLVSRNLIKSDYEKKRDALVKPMKTYYYSVTETVWSPWSDSQMRSWLVDHGIIKSDAQVTRDKMIKLVQDNYLSSKDAFWNAWSDNSIRDWLIDSGYMRSDAQYKRDQLVELANSKWTDQKEKTAAYLTWPDARLRAYLRERGVSEAALPTSRPGLLQETRIRWVQSEKRAETLFAKIKEIVNSGLYKAEDVISHIMSLLKGDLDFMAHKTTAAYDATKHKAQETWEEAKARGVSAEQWAETRSKEMVEEARAQGLSAKEWASRSGEESWEEAKARGVSAQQWVDRQAAAVKARGDAAQDWAAKKGDETWQGAKDTKDSAANWAGKKVEDTGDKVKASGQKLQGEL